MLRIKQAKAGKDDGMFTCVANNGLGEAKSDASLKIYPKVDGVDGKSAFVVTVGSFCLAKPRVLKA